MKRPYQPMNGHCRVNDVNGGNRVLIIPLSAKIQGYLINRARLIDWRVYGLALEAGGT